MSNLFNEMIAKYLDKYTVVDIANDYYEKIVEFAEQVIKKKIVEIHHQVDNHSELKRFTTGLLGEAALEQLFGIKIIDWTIGNSSYYHHPDIPGYRVGIKTVEHGKFPIFFKKNDYPQIICIRSKV